MSDERLDRIEKVLSTLISWSAREFGELGVNQLLNMLYKQPKETPKRIDKPMVGDWCKFYATKKQTEFTGFLRYISNKSGNIFVDHDGYHWDECKRDYLQPNIRHRMPEDDNGKWWPDEVLALPGNTEIMVMWKDITNSPRSETVSVAKLHTEGYSMATHYLIVGC